VVEALSVAVLTVAGTAKALHLFPFSSSHAEEPKSWYKVKVLTIEIKGIIEKYVPLFYNKILCLLAKKNAYS
jgi:hypothetical protein